MNLEELKQSLDNKMDMSYIYSKIRNAAEDGETKVYFDHRGSEDDDEISDTQVEILREQGYAVHWERACLWYEVSGW